MQVEGSPKHIATPPKDIEGSPKHIDANFVEIDAKFVNIDANFVNVDANFVEINAKFVNLAAKIVTIAVKMKYTSPYLGKHIEESIYEKRITVSQFAKQLGVSVSSIYHLFKRHDIEVELLRKISEVLNCDFFRYYLAEPVPTETQLKETLETTQKELESLKKQTQALQNENTYLKEINLMLKDKAGK